MLNTKEDKNKLEDIINNLEKQNPYLIGLLEMKYDIIDSENDKKTFISFYCSICNSKL